MLTRDELLAYRKAPVETVKLPEGEVRIRGLIARELLDFQRALELGKKNGVSTQDQDAFPAKLLVRCIVDEEGKPILSPDDWPSILEWPGTTMQKLAAVAFRLCGYTNTADENP